MFLFLKILFVFFQDNDKKISPLTFGPPENPCVANCRMVLKTHPISVHRRSWSTEENENLAKGLKQQVQETLLIEAIERSRYYLLFLF